MRVFVRLITAVAVLAGSTAAAAYVAWRLIFEGDAWLSVSTALMFVGTVTLTYANLHWLFPVTASRRPADGRTR